MDWQAKSRKAREEGGVGDYEPLPPFVAERTLDRSLWYEGQLLVMYADGPSVGQSCCIWEGNIPDGMGPPPHVHLFQHEIFYILEGHLTAWIEGIRHEVPKYALIFLPAGRAHWFVSAAPVTRMLSLTVTAADFSSTHNQRRLFEYLGEPARALTLPDAVRKDLHPDPAVLAEIADEGGSKIFDVGEEGWRRAFGAKGEVGMKDPD